MEQTYKETFEKNIARLQQIIKECKEEKLKYYCECLLKMNVACCKIDKIDMLSYIRQVMFPAMLLVTKYFDTMQQEYETEGNGNKKLDILNDIESSIVEIGNVFETVVYATNGADRMLVQTAPITVGLNCVAPKLCAYYTLMLNRLTQILPQESDGNYAFAVYPTLHSESEAIILFNERKESGKVGVIRVPEKDITKVRQLSTIITHELFHIRTKKARFRKKRATVYLKVILYSFDMDFLKDTEEWSNTQKEAVRRLLFERIVEEIENDCWEKTEDDRFFYSYSLINYFANTFRKGLWELQNIVVEEFAEKIIGDKEYKTWEAFNADFNKAKEQKSIIEQEIYRLLSRDEIKNRCIFYMDIFREVYADLFSVITLRSLPESYFSTFQYTPRDTQQSVFLYFRTYFVAEILSSDEIKYLDTMNDFANAWKNWNGRVSGVDSVGRKTNEFAELIKKQDSFDNVNNARSFGIYLNAAIISVYKDYFIECCNVYLEYETENLSKFEEFRKHFMYGVEMSRDKVVSEIAKFQWKERNSKGK